MGLYNNNIKMQDLFCNKKLAGIIPQLDKRDIDRGKISDYKIFARCKNILNGLLGGVIKGDTIEVSNKSTASVMALVRAEKAVLEAMFNNSDKLLFGLKANAKLYTSATNIAQISELTDSKQKIKLLKEILDNLRYNEDFQYGKVSQGKRKQEWERKVGIRK